MKNILNFLLKIRKLREIPRRGWVLRGVKNPETIAEHSFRLTIMAWLFSIRKEKMNIERILKIALAHELSKISARDATPYDKIISQKKKATKNIFQTWPTGLKREKEKISYRNYKEEYSALKKLTSDLPSPLRDELIGYWDDYQRGLSREGRFLRQVYRIENLLQALEYWEKDKKFPIEPWWQEAEGFVDDPVLIEFLEKMDRRFYEKKKTNGELDFLLKIGKLKILPRTGHVLRGVRDPSTVAEDAFFLAMTVWVLNKKKKLNLERTLKMALVYEICEIYAEDQTPYEGILPEDIQGRRKMLERWPRFPIKEKVRRFLRDYKTEKRALEKLTIGLPSPLKKEIISLWNDHKKRLTFEGNFVNQIYWVAMMMQVLQYWKKDKKFPIFGWWEQILEFIDEPLGLDFLEELEKKFFKKY